MAYPQQISSGNSFGFRTFNFCSNIFSINRKKSSFENTYSGKLKLSSGKNLTSSGIFSAGLNNKSAPLQDEEKNTFLVSATAGYLKEIEEDYNTASIYQKYKINKEFSEKINLGLIENIEYSKRQQIGIPDTNRWYDNTTLNLNYSFNPFNVVSLFGGISFSDTTFTTYGLSYRAIYEKDNFSVSNSLTGSYDYFYFWNQISQNYISDNVNLAYNELEFSAEFFEGVVEYNYIEDYTALAKNPNTMLNFQVQYRIFESPVVNAGVLYNFRNFKYHSPLYYSPQDRSLYGGFVNFYDTFGNLYLYLNGGARVDNNSVFIWDMDSELGYFKGDFSASLGVGRYNDPYYTNYNTFINFSQGF